MSKGYQEHIGTYVTDTGEIRFGRVLLILNDQLWAPSDFSEVLIEVPGKRMKLAKKIAKYWDRVMREAEALAKEWESADVRVYRIDEDGVEDVTDKHNPGQKEDPLANED